ncbi:hypothetical protein FRC01_007656 [Tulasnella sp. 417]|nr:hypothetical protein FRC01_007656 [Tulasnella sp. 417]
MAMVDYTTVLPPETWLAVVEFLAVPPSNPYTRIATSQSDAVILKSSSDIRTVCSLSRFFLQLADPYRFREVHFKIDPAKSSIHKLRRIEKLLDLLDRRQEVKSWIRTFSIGRTPSEGRLAIREDNFDEEYLALEPKIHKAVPELQDLRSLRCGLVSFPSSLFDGILRLPHLDDLQLEDLQFIQGTADQTPMQICQNESPLRRLTIESFGPLSTPVTQALNHLLLKKTLAVLIYWPPLFPDPQTWISLLWVISTYIPDYVFTSLREVDIILPTSNADVQHFVQFGARCPNLVSLTISWNYLEESLGELENQLRGACLAEHPFPALQKFAGPLALASIFVEGRPVHSVMSDFLYEFNWNRSGATLASQIAALRPGVPLRVLHLAAQEWKEADFETIAQHHPDLEELVYELYGPDLMRWSSRLEDALRKLAKLKSITLKQTSSSDNLTNGVDDDHYLIVKLRSLCPNLQQANMPWLGIWKRHPQRKD